MSSSIVGINPTFLLQKIDPVKIREKYFNGDYAQLTLPSTKINVNVPANLMALQPTLGTSPECDVYTFRTKSNTIQTVATTNHQSYVILTTQGVSPPLGGDCDWCRLKFSHAALGIPVKMDEVRPDINSDPILIYYVDRCLCSFECCLAYLKKHYAMSYRHRDPLYSDSEQMLRSLYAKVHPKAGFLSFRQANDYDLLRANHGSLDEAEFRDSKHIYERTPNIVVAPIKVQYLKQAI
jgi:hypothetical protein